MEAAYIKHPVSQELKKQINRLGYAVIDAKFAPDGYQLPDELKGFFRQPETVEPETVENADIVKRKGRPPKVKEPETVEPETETE